VTSLLSVVAPPGAVALSLSDAKAHLRLSGTDDDAYVTALIEAATGYFEDQTALKLITQTLLLSLPDWPCDVVLRLPRMPVQSVSSVKYLDGSGTLQTLAGSAYVVSIEPPQAVVVPASGTVWPMVQTGQPQGVRVEFVAGFGASASNVPELVKHGLKFLVAHWYANREPAHGQAMTEAPMAVQSIMQTVRMPVGV